jgi:hypothetical protein
MGSLLRFVVRVVMITLALVLIIFGAVGFSQGDRVAAGAVWFVALLLLWASRRRRSAVSWRNDPGTEKQMSYLDDMSVPYRADATKGELHDLIDAFHQAKRRRR